VSCLTHSAAQLVRPKVTRNLRMAAGENQEHGASTHLMAAPVEVPSSGKSVARSCSLLGRLNYPVVINRSAGNTSCSRARTARDALE